MKREGGLGEREGKREGGLGERKGEREWRES